MLLHLFRLTCCITMVLTGAACAANAPIIDEPERAEEILEYRLQGDYAGAITVDGHSIEKGVQVALRDDDQFKVLIFEGGLPGAENPDPAEPDVYEAELGESIIRVENDYRWEVHEAGITVIGEDGESVGQLSKVERESPTAGLEPPEGAVVLFDGENLDMWAEGAEMTEDGLLKQGPTTRDDYGDKFLHLEYKLPFWPADTANSGIYVQRRYEVQILDSYGDYPPRIYGDGSLYNEYPPRINATYPPLVWQTYDIWFRAPRFDENGDKVEDARLTVLHNGVLIHDDATLEQGTGAGGDRAETALAQTYFQDHTGEVRFRNVWLIDKGDPSAPRAPTVDELLALTEDQ